MSNAGGQADAWKWHLEHVLIGRYQASVKPARCGVGAVKTMAGLIAAQMSVIRQELLLNPTTQIVSNQ